MPAHVCTDWAAEIDAAARHLLAAYGCAMNETAARGATRAAGETTDKPPAQRRDVVMTIISARRLRPGHLITTHPDHPERQVRLLVDRLPVPCGCGRLRIDYTAPADDLPGHEPNGRASGRLLLTPEQHVEIEIAQRGAA
ncbi:hypothetical protein ACQEU3_47160 [Spirillospora sp. CA-253888]